MKSRKTKMTEILDDTIKYFGEKLSRRCTNSTNCEYNPAKVGKEGVSEGCAIGRYMTKTQKAQAPTDTAVSGLDTELMPRKLKDLPISFLTDLQILHDSRRYWGKGRGLSQTGKNFVNGMRENIEDGTYEEFPSVY